ncbi:uncharacterized protein PAC_08223 [Phialocephala subalpina]|uniref:F-box domain-containing protein n=1 Tax=Phialocephala subalpina TaxID=576137 RepID=A0A1L7WZY9_9HELO|nr:uncharacterized protein PAC_08223 [Phialocephala subalpina]
MSISSPPPPALLNIPLEIQNSITSHLKTPDILSLRLTCTHFELTIPPPTHIQLLITEKTSWAQVRNLYTCKDCLCLRPSNKFADAMKKGKKGLNGKEPQKRFCVDCGTEPKRGETRYSPGTEIVVEGERRVFCEWCRKWKGGKEVGCPGSRECRACHGNEKVGCGFCMRGEYVERMRREDVRRNRNKRKRGRESDWDDDLPDEYDEHFWECYDPAD